MAAPLRSAVAPDTGQGVQRPHQARTGQQLVRQGRGELAHHGPHAHERVGPDEQHQPGHRAGGPAGHQAHTGDQEVLVLTHHQDLRHRGNASLQCTFGAGWQKPSRGYVRSEGARVAGLGTEGVGGDRLYV